MREGRRHKGGNDRREEGESPDAIKSRPPGEIRAGACQSFPTHLNHLIPASE